MKSVCYSTDMINKRWMEHREFKSMVPKSNEWLFMERNIFLSQHDSWIAEVYMKMRARKYVEYNH